MSNVTTVINKTAQLGDDLLEKFKRDNCVKTANASISAYRACISGAKLKMQYEKALKNLEINRDVEFLEF